MPKIKEIKKKGKKTLKNNLWTLILIGIFMTFIINEYIINNDGFNNLEIINELIQDKREGKNIEFFDKENPNVMINEYLDKAVSKLVSGNINSINNAINSYNEKNNVTKGVFFTTFTIITKGQDQIQNLMNSIMEYENKEQIESIMLIIAASLGILLKIFVANPLLVGESRVYLESINYKKTKTKRLIYSFKRHRYISIVKSVFIMRLYKTLWNFTVIGGLIKNYSYKMVTYILAENPNINGKDAIKMSREMMDGYKLLALKLDLSFIRMVDSTIYYLWISRDLCVSLL